MGSNDPFLVAPGRERPDYTIFTFPAANLTDTSAEEVELDQALSLQGRQGRDFLGAWITQLVQVMALEHLTIGTADHDMRAIIRLQSRTGTAFAISDPELLWQYGIHAAVTAPTTATSESFQPVFENVPLGEPELYVAPRLFWRFDNNIDATVNADALKARMASVSRRLTFELFIELLERFADVTLL